MQMTPSERSSYIAKIGYDEATHTMRVEFKDGSLFETGDATVETFKAWLKADSWGSYWHKHVKLKYTFARVKE